MNVTSTPQPTAPEAAAEHQPGAGGGLRVPRRAGEVAAVLVGTALIGLQGARLGAWIVDDAAVTFAYARSVAEGLGPVQQPGALPVEGYSNPTWLALLTLGRLLGVFDHGSLAGMPDLVWFPKTLALVCAAGVLTMVLLVARTVVPRLAWAAVLLCGIAMAADFSLVTWWFSGLENPLYGLLVAALGALTARAAVRRTVSSPRLAAGCGALAVALALTRPDGAVYAAAAPVLLLATPGLALRARLRSLLITGAAFALPYAGFLVWRHAEFGRWVPNTAVAKSQGAPALDSFSRAGELLDYAGWAAVLLVAVAVGLAVARPGTARRALFALAVPLGLAFLGYGALRPDWMALYRFATPVWVLGSMVAAIALVQVWAWIADLRQRAALAAAVVVSLTLSLAGQAAAADAFLRAPTVPMCTVAERFGETFDAYADRLGLGSRASVLLPDLGGTLLTTRLRVVDLAGLTDPVVADSYAAEDMGALRRYVFGTVRPDFIHVHGIWGAPRGLTPAVLTAHGYVQIVRTAPLDGDWVRAADVPDPQRLQALRAWAAHTVPHLTARLDAHPLAPCGNLHPPQT